MSCRPRIERLPAPRRATQRDRGAATLELVVIFPVVLLITFGVIEAALWYHARNVAIAAAEEGVRAATGDGGTADAGVEEATDFALRAGSDDVLSNVTVGSTSDDNVISITVTGHSLTLFPGWSGHEVAQTATGPIEQFTEPD